MSALVVLLAIGIVEKVRAEALVHQLGHANFAVRDTATAQLRRLDLAALPALREALNDPDPEIARRGRMLTDQIEARHGMLDGFEFRVVTDRTWKVPSSNADSSLVLCLRVTNRADLKRRFVFDCTSVTLATATGKAAFTETI